jgi:dihydroorotate dehydrogenase
MSPLIGSLLFRFQPETAHAVAMGCLRAATLCDGLRRALHRRNANADGSLAQKLWGRTFAHPVGLAAGFDKDARGIEVLAALGFGHIEVGTLTGQPQPGNPRPRSFRLPADRALINRMGFNNGGAAAAAARLARAYDPAGGARRPPGILGINIGKTKVVDLEHALDDYRISVAALGHLADYLVVNVSSPNTPGLRDLQAESALRPLLTGVRAALDAAAPGTPLLLKIAPDLADAGIDAAVEVALETGCNGLIVSNTTITRDGLSTPAEQVAAIGAGGLSGAPVRARSTAVLARAARRVAGRVPLIGVGGIETAADAWEKIVHGASLVQVYTGFVYAGPAMVPRLLRGLEHHLEETGISHISNAVGRAL